MAAIQNLYIDQGTTFSLAITVSDQYGEGMDLTNYTVTSQMRKSYQSVTTAKTTPLDGILTISLTANQTSAISSGRYVYDIEITSNVETVRVLEGIVVINPEVTR